jgi:hypothetical protein
MEINLKAERKIIEDYFKSFNSDYASTGATIDLKEPFTVTEKNVTQVFKR